MDERKTCLIVSAVVALGLTVPSRAVGPTPVAVFNFQLTTADPNGEWRWLEKFLSDQITTDFHASGEVAVVARDRMQFLAQELGWVPEMATRDPARMKQIQKGLKITHLVSGVCGVRGDALEIVGQVVDVRTRRELYRKKLTGKTGDVLTMQKRLSADLLSWFTKRPVRLILPNLPVWTRSIPAARALYEGMDLYDQGRYHEGWLKFRQSSRKDPAYVEAVYWVGKMYYFTDRYRHARRAFDRFVYLDLKHPRMLDCAKEYLHTYEKLGKPPERMLSLYRSFLKRFAGRDTPDLKLLITVDHLLSSEGRLNKWLSRRVFEVLDRLGRHGEAVRLGGSAAYAATTPTQRQLFRRHMIHHYQLTGEMFGFGDLAPGREGPIWMLDFTGGVKELTSWFQWRDGIRKRRILGEDYRDIDRDAVRDNVRLAWSSLVIAPSGHYFRRLRLYPIATGDDAILRVCIPSPFVARYTSHWLPRVCRSELTARHLDGARWGLDAGAPAACLPISADIATARRKGILIEDLPRAGMLWLRFDVRVRHYVTSRPVVIEGVRVVPEFEKLGRHGAIRVSCAATPHYRVEINGRPRHHCRGLIGPLPAGQHTVGFFPLDPNGPFEPWTTTVTVQPGRTVLVRGRLGWRRTDAWSSWDTPVLINGGAAGSIEGPPRMQMDTGAIRLVWSQSGDIWTSVSTDGRTFSQPRKLPLPVSSAWWEAGVRCLRDESGRYILTFTSDRDAQHRCLLYLSWSRDFVNWSAPAVILDRSMSREYDILQDRAGRYILLSWWGEGEQRGTRGQVIKGGGRTLFDVWASRDALAWRRRCEPVHLPMNPKGGGDECLIFQREDGKYIVVGMDNLARPIYKTRFVKLSSPDLVHWEASEVPEVLASVSYGLSRIPAPRRTDLIVFNESRLSYAVRRARGEREGLWSTASALIRLCQNGDADWRRSAPYLGVATRRTSMGHHPKWGYCIAAAGPSGIYFLRGQRFSPAMNEVRPAEVSKPEPRAKRKSRLGKLTYTSPAYVQRAQTPVCLTTGSSLVHARGWRDGRGLEPPATGSGTVHPKAKVLTMQWAGATVKMAIDANSPQAQHPDVLRVDWTGKGDFHQATVISRRPIGSGRTHSNRGPLFLASRLPVTLGGQKLSISFEGSSSWRRSWSSFWLRSWMSAKASCLFGDKAHTVRFFDSNGNLLFADAVTTPRKVRGYYYLDCQMGDHVYVDVDSLRRGSSAAASFYGQPILVDGWLWNVKVAPDRKSVVTERYEGPTGQVRIDHPFWDCWLVSDKHVVFIYGGSEPVPVPVGKYWIWNFGEYAKPGNWDTRVHFGGNYVPWHPKPVSIHAGRTHEVKVGSPFSVRLDVQQIGRTLRLRVLGSEVSGLPVPSDQGRKVLRGREAVVQISDATGKLVGQIRRKDSLDIGHRADWPIPQGLTGRCTVTLKCGPAPFKLIKKSTVSFTIR